MVIVRMISVVIIVIVYIVNVNVIVDIVIIIIIYQIFEDPVLADWFTTVLLPQVVKINIDFVPCMYCSSFDASGAI